MNIKNHLDTLDFRIDSISELKELLENQNVRILKDIRKEYYLEIAYFVHAIHQNYELNFLFKELLSYTKKLQQLADYSEALKNIKLSIKSISSELLSHEKIKDFEIQCPEFVNPFEPLTFPPVLMTNELLTRLNNIDNFDLRLSYSDLYSLFFNENENGILNKFWNICSTGFELVHKELGLFFKNLQTLVYYENFQHDYKGVNSAIRLLEIYRSLLPFDNRGEDDDYYLIREILQSGDEIPEGDKLLDHCKKIREYFKQKLNSKQSIELSIVRFKHFMEVFCINKISTYTEDIFQKEFELFMFSNGYFALSQGQIGNGRFDNIIFDDNNAFLFEHKLIGFGKTNRTKKEHLLKFQNSKIQAKIYHERLRLLPELSKDVYIIIVTKYYLRFKNDISEIQKDGLNFKFKLICLDKIVPSKIREIKAVDINDIIN